jgi:dipeptidyl aminopeptidase/acylaminoacyl peptidase
MVESSCRWIIGALAAFLSVTACQRSTPSAGSGQAVASKALPSAAPAPQRLPALRAALRTTVSAETDHTPAPTPPAKTLLEKVFYPSPLGKNVAYVSPVKPGAKRPGIVWIAGGMDWGIADSAWGPAPRNNDQSARAFREAGVASMLPALRGSNENPGHNECFLGEIDDVIAAADYLAKRPDVDPERLYLGGHSTGGTMVLLVVESTQRFRAAFAFGPVADPRQYGDGGCLRADAPEVEAKARSPIEFLQDIRTPTFVLEGELSGNAQVLPMLRDAKGGAPLEILVIPRADHFSALATASEDIAKQILADSGATTQIKLDVAAIAKRAPAPEPR